MVGPRRLGCCRLASSLATGPSTDGSGGTSWAKAPGAASASTAAATPPRASLRNRRSDEADAERIKVIDVLPKRPDASIKFAKRKFFRPAKPRYCFGRACQDAAGGPESRQNPSRSSGVDGVNQQRKGAP